MTTTATTPAVIESKINFTREDYEVKQQAQDLAPFDEFLQNIADAVNENGGTIDDAVFMAEDAFTKL